METKDILIFILVFAYAAFRIYQKYGKKGNSETSFWNKKPDKFSQPDKGDEYEPYSKK